MRNNALNQLDNTAPVVALHSSASSSRQWRALRDEAATRQDILTPELPGYDRDVARPQSAIGMAAVAQPLIELIEKLDEPVHLVGHSFGGGAALKIALSRPELVKSLTLYEPVAFHLLNNGSENDADLLQELTQIALGLMAVDGAADAAMAMQKFIDFWGGMHGWDGLTEKQQLQLSQQTAIVARDFQDAFAETWAVDHLANLTVPSQILMGMDSPAVAQRVSTLVFNAIPNAELVMLPGLGHMAPVTSPEWVNPRIIQHVARVERRARPCQWPLRSAA